MIKKILLLSIFICSLNTYAQEGKFWLYGKIKDSDGIIKNANVVNLKSKTGTFSNDFGDYKILVSVGDTLKFTSVQHKTVFRIINNLIYTSEVLDIHMVKTSYVLDEIVVKQHDLDGYLSLDRKKTPPDRRADALKSTLDFSDVDFRIRYDGDHIDQKVRPHVVRVDPNMGFIGAGAKAILPFKYSERLWALRKKVAFQKSFPNMLISEFGKRFFEEDLKIPSIRYYHFLEYCNPLGIESLYQEGKKIELINILRRESEKYLKLLEQENKE